MAVTGYNPLKPRGGSLQEREIRANFDAFNSAVVALQDGTQSALYTPTGGVPRTIASKLNEALSVTDYGAIGDGVTNDRTVLQSILSAGLDLYIPRGKTCLVGSALSVSTNGTRIYGGGKIITTAASNYNAINIAADDCVVENVTIVGTGAGSFQSGVCVKLTGNRNRVRDCFISGYYTAGVFITSGADNEVTRCTFTAGTAYEYAADVLIQTSSSGGETIARTRVIGNIMNSGGGYGIAQQALSGSAAISTIKDSLFSGNTIQTYTTYGIMSYKQINGGDAYPPVITGTIVSSNRIDDIKGSPLNGGNKFYGAGIYMQGDEGFVVSANNVTRTNQQTDNQQLAPGGIGVANSGAGDVVGNYIEGCTLHGIYLNDASDLGVTDGAINVVGNTIRSCAAAGIAGGKAKRVNISDNVLVNNGTFGITLTGTGGSTDISLLNNKIHHIGGNNSLINVNVGTNITIKGNKLRGSKTTSTNGIGCFDIDRITVQNNDLYYIGAANIYIDSNCTEVCVTSNSISRKNSGARGIVCDARGLYASNNLGTGWAAVHSVTSATTDRAYTGIYAPEQLALPTTGTWVAGDEVIVTWGKYRCITGGEPGTWESLGRGDLTAKTSNYTLIASDCYNNTFTNSGAAGTITFSAPASVAGMSVLIYRATAQAVRFDPNGTETVGGGGSGKYLELQSDKGFVRLRCISAGAWVIAESAGTIAYEP